MSIKIPYGTKNGMLVHISEVESGLQEDVKCVSPLCDSSLVACKGSVRKHYFRHEKECSSPHTALESLLHLLVKEVLEEDGMLRLPSKSQIAIFLEDRVKLCHLEDVEVEKRISLEKRKQYIVADVVGQMEGTPLIVEVFVTHRVDTAKKELIERLGIPSIEVDFSDFTYDTSKEEVKQILLDASRARWIYYPIDEEMLDLYSLIFREEPLQSMHDCRVLRRGHLIAPNHGHSRDCSSCPKGMFIRKKKVICSGCQTFRTPREFRVFIRDKELGELLDEILKNDVMDRGSFYGRELLEDFLRLVEKKKHKRLSHTELGYMRKMFKLIKGGNVPNLLEVKKMERIIGSCN